MKTYGFIPEYELPAGPFREVLIPGALEREWTVTGDYSRVARNHCAAVLITNLVRYFMDRSSIDRIKARTDAGKVFYDVHDKVGNGPILRFFSKAKRYVRPMGYQIDHRKVKDLETFRDALRRGRPCVMLLMAEALEWHWVLAVGLREYEDGTWYLRLADGWHRKADIFWKWNEGSRFILGREVYIHRIGC